LLILTVFTWKVSCQSTCGSWLRKFKEKLNFLGLNSGQKFYTRGNFFPPNFYWVKIFHHSHLPFWLELPLLLFWVKFCPVHIVIPPLPSTLHCQFQGKLTLSCTVLCHCHHQYWQLGLSELCQQIMYQYNKLIYLWLQCQFGGNFVGNFTHKFWTLSLIMYWAT
jgi:hypothetical protein